MDPAGGSCLCPLAAGLGLVHTALLMASDPPPHACAGVHWPPGGLSGTDEMACVGLEEYSSSFLALLSSLSLSLSLSVSFVFCLVLFFPHVSHMLVSFLSIIVPQFNIFTHKAVRGPGSDLRLLISLTVTMVMCHYHSIPPFHVLHSNQWWEVFNSFPIRHIFLKICRRALFTCSKHLSFINCLLCLHCLCFANQWNGLVSFA